MPTPSDHMAKLATEAASYPLRPFENWLTPAPTSEVVITLDTASDAASCLARKTVQIGYMAQDYFHLTGLSARILSCPMGSLTLTGLLCGGLPALPADFVSAPLDLFDPQRPNQGVALPTLMSDPEYRTLLTGQVVTADVTFVGPPGARAVIQVWAIGRTWNVSTRDYFRQAFEARLASAASDG